MATLEKLIQDWNTEFSKISKSLTRFKVFEAIDPSFAANYAVKVFQSKLPGVSGEVGDAAINTFLEAERTRYLNDDINSIDPVTMYDILDGVIWPTIAAEDSSFVDCPTDPQLNSMRGVPLKNVFGGNKIKGTDLLHKLSPNWPFTQKARTALEAVIAKANTIDLDTTLQKKTLNSMFQSEDASKLMYISYGRLPELGYPIQTMATLNPYLGYLLTTIGWLGGSSSITTRGISAAVEEGKDGKGFVIANLPKAQGEAIGSAATIGVFGSLNSTIAALGANYTWLQKQKTDATNKVYFTGWSNRFMKNPKSILNMAIILNEVVNINSQLTYRYSPKTKKRLLELGEAYRIGFSITVND